MDNKLLGLYQKRNRYFVSIDNKSNNFKIENIEYGFQSKVQWENWLVEMFRTYGLDWRVSNYWKLKEFSYVFCLIDKNNKPVKL